MSVSANTLFERLRREDPEFRRAQDEIADSVALARNIIRLRKAHGWTQKDLAQHADTKQPRIAELESGIANPKLDTLRRVADALGTSASRLLDGEERRPAKQFVFYTLMSPAADPVDFKTPVPRAVYGSTAQSRIGDWAELEGSFR